MLDKRSIVYCERLKEFLQSEECTKKSAKNAEQECEIRIIY